MQMKEANVSVCSDHWIRLCPGLWLQQWFLCCSTLSWQVVTSPNCRRSFIICIRANLKRLHHVFHVLHPCDVILNIEYSSHKCSNLKTKGKFLPYQNVGSRCTSTSNTPLIISTSETHFQLILEPQNWIPVNQLQGKESAPVSMDTFLPWCYNTESQIRAVVHFSLLLCIRTLQHCYQPSGISSSRWLTCVCQA